MYEEFYSKPYRTNYGYRKTSLPAICPCRSGRTIVTSIRLKTKDPCRRCKVYSTFCEFLGVTPQQFFDDGNAYPAQLAALIEDLTKLDAESLEHIAAIVKELVKDE